MAIYVLLFREDCRAFASYRFKDSEILCYIHRGKTASPFVFYLINLYMVFLLLQKSGVSKSLSSIRII